MINRKQIKDKRIKYAFTKPSNAKMCFAVEVTSLTEEEKVLRKMHLKAFFEDEVQKAKDNGFKGVISEDSVEKYISEQIKKPLIMYAYTDEEIDTVEVGDFPSPDEEIPEDLYDTLTYDFDALDFKVNSRFTNAVIRFLDSHPLISKSGLAKQLGFHRQYFFDLGYRRHLISNERVEVIKEALEHYGFKYKFK